MAAARSQRSLKPASRSPIPTCRAANALPSLQSLTRPEQCWKHGRPDVDGHGLPARAKVVRSRFLYGRDCAFFPLPRPDSLFVPRLEADVSHQVGLVAVTPAAGFVGACVCLTCASSERCSRLPWQSCVNLHRDRLGLLLQLAHVFQGLLQLRRRYGHLCLYVHLTGQPGQAWPRSDERTRRAGLTTARTEMLTACVHRSRRRRYRRSRLHWCLCAIVCHLQRRVHQDPRRVRSLYFTFSETWLTRSVFFFSWLDQNYRQVGLQLAWVCAVFGWCFVVSYILMFLIDHIPGLHFRSSEEAEIIGVDEAELGGAPHLLPTISCVLTRHSSRVGVRLRLCQPRSRRQL